MTAFSTQQRLSQATFREHSATFSTEGRRHGSYRGKAYPFLLRPDVWRENLYPELRGCAPAYFAARGVVWHRMRRHLLSSQVCCLNFLMPFSRDPSALEALLADVFCEAVEVLPIEGDGEDAGYVGFEWIGGDHLGETVGGSRSRGANCTSADAVVRIRRRRRVEVWLIEWKYTESYGAPLEPRGHETRRTRYSHLTCAPGGPIKNDLKLSLDDFFYEPFYQLLRQQILAHRMQATREQGADRVGVLHLAPASNTAFQKVTAPVLRKFGGTVTEVWPQLLADPDAFRSCTLEELFGARGHAAGPEHSKYLVERYRFVKGVE